MNLRICTQVFLASVLGLASCSDSTTENNDSPVDGGAGSHADGNTDGSAGSHAEGGSSVDGSAGSSGEGGDKPPVKDRCSPEGSVGCTPTVGVELLWDTARLAIDEQGRLLSLSSKPDGTEIAAEGDPFCHLDTKDGLLVPTSAKQCGDRVIFDFPSGYSLTFQIAMGSGFSAWELCEMQGDLDRVLSARLASLVYGATDRCRGVVNTCERDGFAAGVMTSAVNVRPTLESGASIALTTAEHGLNQGGFGIIAAPTEKYARAIEAFQLEVGLPSPRLEGVWGKESPVTRRSYLFVFGADPDKASDIAAWAKRGNFGTVLLGDWSESFGHHDLKKSAFPDGIASFSSLVKTIHDAGLGVGIHFMAPSISPHDPYVTPVPDPRLVKDLWVTLADGISANDTFLPTLESTAEFPKEDGGYSGKGRFLHIGNEIIEYESPSTSPQGFHIKQRGALGTTSSAHASGTRAGHLQRSYGQFLFDLDTDLATEVAQNVATIANAANIDMLYFDGSEKLQGDHWYYNAKLHDTYYRALSNPNTLVQASSLSSYSWHLISRMASADGHGDIKGYLDDRLPTIASYGTYFMPADIGWYYLFDQTVTEDQFEYVLQKSLGMSASISLETSVSSLNTHPVSERIIDMISTYEKLRLDGKVSSSTRQALREPGVEYRMLSNPDRLRRIVFQKLGDSPEGDWRTITSLDGKQNVFSFTPTESGCKLGMQLRSGEMSQPGPGYQNAAMLDNLSNPGAYDANSNSSGTTSQLTSESSDCGGTSPCVKFSAQSQAAGGWAYFGRNLAQSLDLSKVESFGFWMKGDGKGGSFKLQFTAGNEYLDYYISNKFTGWRYIHLVRPNNKTFVATRMGLYYNSLPSGSVTCYLDDIKALSTMDHGVENPRLQVGGQGPVFTTKIFPDERLVYYFGNQVEIIPATRGTSRMLPVPSQEITLSGPTTVTFSATQLNASIQVRLVEECSEELPLP